jgi:hypothetical protein
MLDIKFGAFAWESFNLLRWRDSYELMTAYIKKKISEQLRAVAFIVIYLFFFQTFILNLPINELPKIILGIVFVVIGLAFFMEGLVLGVMPIGENLGIKLPSRSPLIGILLFAFLIGLGATFAEPAIGILRTMGASVEAEQAPLLYYLLNQKAHELVLAVGIGVGIAVIFGVLRFLYNWSLKPLIYPLVLTCLGLSIYSFFSTEFSHIVGLAWDCGAVTTGPVTVPLVIALGLGMSRVVTGHSDEGSTSGFGVVTLASLFPIIAVLCLGLYYHLDPPSDFGQSMVTVDRLAASADSSQMQNNDLPTMSLVKDYLKKNFFIAAQAILPLCLFMFILFRVVLRERFKYLDEVILGLVFSIIGLTLFNLGIDFGLGKLGKQVGTFLPSAYSSIRLEQETKVIKGFDISDVHKRYTDQGEVERFFYYQQDHVTKEIPFDSNSFDEKAKTYTFTPSYGPIWNQDSFSLVGIIVVLFFAFLMGYGATLAEPALNTLGATVEDISAGTFKKNMLMQAVAIGVGTGILLGVTKIIWNIPILWLLIPPYCILLILSAISTEEYVNIAWDSAGVTTGPITVPLVLSMGLGIGAQSGAIEGFGILAMASVSPIMSVLIMGLFLNKFRSSIVKDDDLYEDSHLKREA